MLDLVSPDNSGMKSIWFFLTFFKIFYGILKTLIFDHSPFAYFFFFTLYLTAAFKVLRLRRTVLLTLDRRDLRLTPVIIEEAYHKVQLFWEGHKNVRNPPYGLEIYLVNVKTIRTIAETTLFKFFKISVIYCSAIFPPDLALILLEYT